jgi:hypothetical protein
MTLFTIETREFGWDEIAIAAERWGEWQELVEAVRQSLACLHLATETRRLPSEAIIREVTTAFRYEHNLISGEETRAWLKHWGMTAEVWMNCLRGRYLREQWSAQLTEITSAVHIPDSQVADAIKNYAVCDGKLDDWSQKLAGRAAVAAMSSTLLDGNPSSLELITLIEAEFDLKRQQQVTNRLIEAKISNHRLDWVHFQCRYLWLAEECVAREAAWCVTEDGLTLDEVAVDAKGQVQDWSFYADEIEADVRPYFLAAGRGDLLGPLKLQKGYPLFSLLNKSMPAAEDPQIVSRAEQAIVKNLLAQAMNEKVKWVLQ